MGVRKSKNERVDFVTNILKKQKNTCAFADGYDAFCWNAPKNKRLIYLKLEWGHKIPSIKGKKIDSEKNLFLLCSRCNNQIQTSRTIKELIPELEHKIKVLRNLNSR